MEVAGVRDVDSVKTASTFGARATLFGLCTFNIQSTGNIRFCRRVAQQFMEASNATQYLTSSDSVNC